MLIQQFLSETIVKLKATRIANDSVVCSHLY